MLFLKRLSDQEHERLGKDLNAKGIADDVIATQLTNPGQYTFFVPEEAHWSKIRHLKTNVGVSNDISRFITFFYILISSKKTG
jgi:type I restriction enzyme M protein